jgi:hypothetical protein
MVARKTLIAAPDSLSVNHAIPLCLSFCLSVCLSVCLRNDEGDQYLSVREGVFTINAPDGQGPVAPERSRHL